MSVFDTENYASTVTDKLIRSIQLGPKYYFYDIPKYYLYRKRAKLNILDFEALINPFRELKRKEYHNLELPLYYEEALKQCGEAGIKFSMPEIRLKALSSVWWLTRNLCGDAIEFGAYKGATSLFLAKLGKLNSVEQKVLMLDTFEGIPSNSKYDLNRKGGEYIPPNNQIEIINHQASNLGVLDRIIVYKSFFSETIKRISSVNFNFAFVHIDANIYSGTLEACEYTIPRVVNGGGIVFDDYNGLCDLGARLAVDTYLNNKEKPKPLSSASAYLFIKR
jgi:hypothetical protein